MNGNDAEPGPFPAPEPPLGSLLFRVAALRQKLFTDRVGLAPTSLRLLRLLEQTDGMSQAALEAAFEADGAIITRTAKQLEDSGYVRRRPDEVDRRFVRVYLTKAGRQRMAEALKRLEALNAEVFAGISEDDLRVANRVLMQTRANLRQIRQPGRDGPAR